MPIPENTHACVDSGDTAWVLVSTILILGMMPGLAFFEAGLLRAKNTTSIMTQVFSGATILSLIWHLVGYSFVFGTDAGGFIGNPVEYAFARNLPYDECFDGQSIPKAAYAIFEMMFAAITPLLLTGAFAERLKFKSFFAFIISFELLVFYPVAHWVWGKGWLSQLGAVDFAGGIVIHTTAGVGSLVISLMLGRRLHFEKYHGEFPPSSLPLAGIGAAFLWIGWFGFNAGSALQSGPNATSTVVSTQLAAITSGVVWTIISWFRGKGTDRKVPSLVAVMNGVIAGLAGVTPASGYIMSPPSLGLGAVLGFLSYLSVFILKEKLHIDDALDVSSVHGVTGIIGSLSIGLIATSQANPSSDVNGAFYKNPRQMWVQLVAVIVVAAWSAFWTFVIVFIIRKIFGLRITIEQEEAGLDRIEHGEISYHKLHHFSSTEEEAHDVHVALHPQHQLEVEEEGNLN